MRGTDATSGSLFSYVDLEDRIPARHLLRKIRQVVNDALASLDGEFAPLYADFGRPSIAPERLIRASLIQILFSVRSERQLMEQMQYNLMFRWFVGLGIDDPVWVATVFTKNRDRLLTTDMSRKVPQPTASVNILRSTSPTRLARTGVGFGPCSLQARLLGLAFKGRARPAAILVNSFSTSAFVMSVTSFEPQSGATSLCMMVCWSAAFRAARCGVCSAR